MDSYNSCLAEHVNEEETPEVSDSHSTEKVCLFIYLFVYLVQHWQVLDSWQFYPSCQKILFDIVFNKNYQKT